MFFTGGDVMTELSYDPRAPEVHEDPYPFYQRLRDEAPVLHIEDKEKDRKSVV